MSKSLAEKKDLILIATISVAIISFFLATLTWSAVYDMASSLPEWARYIIATSATIAVDGVLALALFIGLEKKFDNKRNFKPYLAIAVVFWMLSVSSGDWGSHFIIEGMHDEPLVDTDGYKKLLEKQLKLASGSTLAIQDKYPATSKFISKWSKDPNVQKQIREIAFNGNTKNWVATSLKTRKIRQRLLAAKAKDEKLNREVNLSIAKTKAKNAEIIAGDTPLTKTINSLVGIEKKKQARYDKMVGSQTGMLRLANIVLGFTYLALMSFILWMASVEKLSVPKLTRSWMLLLKIIVAFIQSLLSRLETLINFDLNGDGKIGFVSYKELVAKLKPKVNMPVIASGATLRNQHQDPQQGRAQQERNNTPPQQRNITKKAQLPDNQQRNINPKQSATGKRNNATDSQQIPQQAIKLSATPKQGKAQQLKPNLQHTATDPIELIKSYLGDDGNAIKYYKSYSGSSESSIRSYKSRFRNTNEFAKFIVVAVIQHENKPNMAEAVKNDVLKFNIQNPSK